MSYIEYPKEAFNKIRFLDHYMEGHRGFIAGGCFKNIFKGQKIKDLDLFFESKNDFEQADAYFSSNEDYVFSYENQNVRAYKNKNTNVRVELIMHTFGSPVDIISMFDFTITKYAYAKNRDAEGVTYYSVCLDSFFADLVNNKLVIDDKLIYPVSTFERSYRYRTYGYGLCKESKAKLIEALKNVSVEDLSNDLYFGLD